MANGGMKTLGFILAGFMAISLTSCGGKCACNGYNPDLIKDYQPSSSKKFQ